MILNYKVDQHQLVIQFQVGQVLDTYRKKLSSTTKEDMVEKSGKCIIPVLQILLEERKEKRGKEVKKKVGENVCVTKL